MEFADDIALGSFTTADFDDCLEEGVSSGREAQLSSGLSGIRLSFAISMALHFLLACVLFYFVTKEITEIEETAPGSIRVEFVAFSPPLSQAEDVVPQAPITQDLVEVTNPAPMPQEPQDNVSNEIEIEQPSAVEVSNAGQLQNSELITMPSVESVQRVLSNLQNNEVSNFLSYDCNKLEEEKEFNNCAPNDVRDYSSLSRNPVYDFHNPAIEVSRSRETITTLARHSARVSDQLNLSELPAGLSGYVLEELEQGIETYSNNSSRALDHMDTMVDKSAAGVMARRLFDNWTQQQSRLLQSRKIENRSESLFRDKCKSYEKYLMVPAEFARCLAIGESPFGFATEF